MALFAGHAEVINSPVAVVIKSCGHLTAAHYFAKGRHVYFSQATIIVYASIEEEKEWTFDIIDIPCCDVIQNNQILAFDRFAAKIALLPPPKSTLKLLLDDYLSS